MNRILSFLLKLTVLIALVATTIYFTVINKSNYGEINNFRLIPQLQDQWCWAANLQMIAEKFGKNVTQCTLVYEEKFDSCTITPTDTCFCGGDIIAKCNAPLSDDENLTALQKFQNKLERLQISSEIEEDLLDFNSIKSEIDKGQPVLLSNVGCNNCGIWNDHALTISGYIQTPIQKFILVNDPWGFINESCVGCKYYLSYDNLKNRTTSTNTTKNQVVSNGISTIHNIHIKSSSTYTTIEALSIFINKLYNIFFGNNTPLRQSIDNNPTPIATLTKKALKDIVNCTDKKVLPKVYNNIDKLEFGKTILFKQIDVQNKETDIYIVQVKDDAGNTVATVSLMQDEEKKDFYITSVSHSASDCYGWLSPPIQLENLTIYYLVKKNQLFYKGKLGSEEYIIPFKDYLKKPQVSQWSEKENLYRADEFSFLLKP